MAKLRHHYTRSEIQQHDADPLNDAKRALTRPEFSVTFACALPKQVRAGWRGLMVLGVLVHIKKNSPGVKQCWFNRLGRGRFAMFQACLRHAMPVFRLFPGVGNAGLLSGVPTGRID